MTDGYSLREVGKLLGLPRSVVNGLIEAGFVIPVRGPRREYRFSFHDLVLLRAAQGLSEAKIPPARILRSLRRLRAQLPDKVPLAGLRIGAVGDAVVVSEGETHWRPDNGQYVFQFQVASPGGRLAFFGPAQVVSQVPDTAWFERAMALEGAERLEPPAELARGVMAAVRRGRADVAAGRTKTQQETEKLVESWASAWTSK